jgi:hypothetical protein
MKFYTKEVQSLFRVTGEGDKMVVERHEKKPREKISRRVVREFSLTKPAYCIASHQLNRGLIRFRDV